MATQCLEGSAVDAGLNDFGLSVLARFGLDDVGVDWLPRLEIFIEISFHIPFHIGLGGRQPGHISSQSDAYTGNYAAVRIPLPNMR